MYKKGNLRGSSQRKRSSFNQSVDREGQHLQGEGELVPEEKSGTSLAEKRKSETSRSCLTGGNGLVREGF